MRPRAIVFDIYRTVLEVGPPPSDAEEDWDRLSREYLGAPAPCTLRDLAAACETLIGQRHAQARDQGIPHPEIDWTRVMTAVLPPLGGLPATALSDFLVRHAGLARQTRLVPGAAQVLEGARRRGLPRAIASNAQAYTLAELDRALADEGLEAECVFPDADLCFWSFQHGFSKPDPHVFRILTTRLGSRGIKPGEILMVGDRVDNDVAPARRAGWQAWHLDPDPNSGRDWPALADHLGFDHP